MIFILKANLRCVKVLTSWRTKKLHTILIQYKWKMVRILYASYFFFVAAQIHLVLLRSDFLPPPTLYPLYQDGDSKRNGDCIACYLRARQTIYDGVSFWCNVYFGLKTKCYSQIHSNRYETFSHCYSAMQKKYSANRMCYYWFNVPCKSDSEAKCKQKLEDFCIFYVSEC